MTNLIGTTLNKYHIKALIGKGAMGEVYRADDTRLEREVAVKVLSEKLASSEKAVTLFEQEARKAAQLNHPNIIAIYDVGEQDDIHYIAMSLLHGRTLQRLLEEEKKPLDLHFVIKILEQAAEALDFAHQHQVVHRDIKPANIMIGENDYVTVMDFGIVEALKDDVFIQTGEFKGITQYMSLEQDIGDKVGVQSDQFSLGVVTYQMLTGTFPYPAGSVTFLYNQVTYKPLLSVSQERPDLPESVTRVLERVLAKNPNDRYPSVMDFVTDLEQALMTHSSNVSPPSYIKFIAYIVLIIVCVFVMIFSGKMMGNVFQQATSTLSPTATFVPPTPTQIPPSPTPSLVPTSTPAPTPTFSPTDVPLPLHYVLENIHSIVEGNFWQHDGLQCLATSLDKSTLAVCDANNVYLLTAHNMNARNQIPVSATIQSLALNANGTMLAVGTDTGDIYLYDDEKMLKKLKLPQNSVANVLTFNSDNSQLISADNKGNLLVWNTNNLTINRQFEQLGSSILALEFEDKCEQIVAGTEQGNVISWNTNTLQSPSFSFELDSTPIYNIQLTPNCDRIALTVGNQIELRDARTGELLQTLVGHKFPVYAMDFNEKGDILASISANGTIRLWDVVAGTTARVLATNGGEGIEIVFGFYLFSLRQEGILQSWIP